MSLTDSQKETVSDWITQGKSLAEVQRLLREEFSISMTYMDVRFLVDDLHVAPKDQTDEDEETSEKAIEEPEVVETQPFDEAKLDCSSTLSKPKDITLEAIVESEDVYDPVFSKIATIFLTSGYQGYVISNIDMNEKFHYKLGYIEEKETIKLEDDEYTSDDEESENLNQELELFKQNVQSISVCHDLSDFRNKFKDEPHSKDIYIEPAPFSLKSQTLNVENEENFSQKDFDKATLSAISANICD